jgi:hypothetical protein
MQTNHELSCLDKLRLVQLTITNLPTSFIWNIISFEEAFKNGDSTKFWDYVLGHALNHSVFWNFV